MHAIYFKLIITGGKKIFAKQPKACSWNLSILSRRFYFFKFLLIHKKRAVMLRNCNSSIITTTEAASITITTITDYHYRAFPFSDYNFFCPGKFQLSSTGEHRVHRWTDAHTHTQTQLSIRRTASLNWRKSQQVGCEGKYVRPKP